MTKYRTKDDDMIDHICFRHYGHENGTVEAVLKANKILVNYGSKLPGGLEITLPDLKGTEEKPVEQVELWS